MSNVNHPPHYNQHKYETIDEMVTLFGVDAVIGFCICNAWKYRERAPYKGNAEEDNKKADWYLTKARELKDYPPILKASDLPKEIPCTYLGMLMSGEFPGSGISIPGEKAQDMSDEAKAFDQFCKNLPQGVSKKRIFQAWQGNGEKTRGEVG